MQNIIARVRNREQLRAASSCPFIGTVIVDFGCAAVDKESFQEDFPGKELWLQLPDVLRENKSDSVKKLAERANSFDGVVLKTLDEIGLWKQVGDAAKPVIGDAFLYACNSEAVAFYRSLLPDMRFLLSDELSDEEALGLIRACREENLAKETDFLYKAYGYQPLMITNQCLNRVYAGCSKPRMEFEDEKKHRFFISSECGQCYDIVYNGLPTSMLDQLRKTEEGFQTGAGTFSNVLLDFTLESGEEVRQILNGFAEGRDAAQSRTRGHHEKGIL